MFKVECFCEDKNLPAILIALAGKALDVKAVPMTNAKAMNGQVTAVTGGDTQDQFRHWLHESKLTRVRSHDIKQFQTEIGRSPMGYSLVLKNAVASGLLTRAAGTTGSHSAYDVNLAAKGSVKPARTEGKTEDLFLGWAKEKKLKQATLADLRTFQTDMGRSEGGFNFLLTKLKKLGILKRPKNSARGTGYEIVR